MLGSMSAELEKAYEMLKQFENIASQAARFYASNGNGSYLRIQREAAFHREDIAQNIRAGFYNSQHEEPKHAIP